MVETTIIKWFKRVMFRENAEDICEKEKTS